MITDTDVQIAGTAGADLALTRTYNHLLADEVGNAAPAGWRGAGRAFPYELEWWNDYVVYRNPDSGYATVFVEQPDGSYEPATRIDAQLERDGTSFELTWNSSGAKEIYHGWGGIDAVEDRSGNRIQYHYDSNYRVSSVEDTQGRVTTLDHATGGQIDTITDPVGRTHTFSYDPNDPDRLLEVEDPAGHMFAYDDTSTGPHEQLLTDTRGNQTRITYETSGQFARVAEIVRITDRPRRGDRTDHQLRLRHR